MHEFMTHLLNYIICYLSPHNRYLMKACSLSVISTIISRNSLGSQFSPVHRYLQEQPHSPVVQVLQKCIKDQPKSGTLYVS